MKFVLGAVAAVSLLVGATAIQPAAAQGRCWWNGYSWVCRGHHWGWRHHHQWCDWGWHRGWRY
jgi:hypothetical protein